MIRRSIACATLVTLMTSAAPAAFAQTASGSRGDVEGDQSSDEIVVTARKVTERLQDVPIAISAVSAEKIAERDNVRVSELAAAVPNVTFSGGPLATITVRGVSSQSRYNPGFDSGIGVYIDGVVQGKSYTFDSPLYDVERVEFLRGPQGTLFGKNAIGGAISIVTRNPSFTPTGQFELSTGSFNRFEAQGFVSAPLSSTLAVSVGGFRVKRDGYVRNLLDNRRFANDDSYGGRAKFLWKPSDFVKLVLSADYLNEDNYGYVDEISAGYGGPTGRYESNVNTPTLARRKSKGISLTADIESGFGATLTSITAYRWAENQRTNDSDVGPLSIVVSESASKQTQFSQELRLSGKLGDRIKYLIGGYLFRQDTNNFAQSTFGPDSGFAPLRGQVGNTFGEADTEAVAAFASVDWELVDKLTATVGIRYTDEAKRLNYQQKGFPLIGAPNLPQEFDRISATDVSPTFTLRYQPSRAIMVYGTASKGFKSGGWNVDNITSPRITTFKALRFGDESLWNYELGIKAQFLDNRVTFNADVFRQDYSDIQTPQLTQVLGGGGAVVAIVTNAASARLQGVEAELTVRPTGILTLNGVLGYTDAKYTKYTDGALNFSGNRLPGAPKWTGNLSATLRVPVSDDWSLGARGEYLYRSSTFGDRENSAARKRPAYASINLSAGIYGKHFDLVGFVNNLADKQDVILIANGGFPAPIGLGLNTLVTRQLGRTWGLRLAGRF